MSQVDAAREAMVSCIATPRQGHSTIQTTIEEMPSRKATKPVNGEPRLLEQKP